MFVTLGTNIVKLLERGRDGDALTVNAIYQAPVTRHSITSSLLNEAEQVTETISNCSVSDVTRARAIERTMNTLPLFNGQQTCTESLFR